MKNFALGRYIPYKGLAHRIDPRAKIFITLLVMVAIFMPYPSWEMTALMQGICLITCTLIAIISHVSPAKMLSGMKTLWFMILIVALLYILVPYRNPRLPLAFNMFGWRDVYWDSFAESGRIFLRLFMMLELSLALTTSTSPLNLTYGIEWYMYPLKFIGFPSHIVAMTISLALRFIPTILDDVERIIKAQASRGVDFKGGLGRKFRAIVSLIIPLFVSSFTRSAELADAMEVRGYDPKGKRTRYEKLTFKWYDILLVIFFMAFLAAFITLTAMKFDIFVEWFGLGVH